MTEHHEAGPPPRVSVVIATRNRADGIEAVVESLRAQSKPPPFEVIIVDDGSSPPVSQTALSSARSPWTALHVVREEGIGPARARNAGVRRARGEYIAFTDDDTLPDSTWLATLVSFLDANPEALGVEGPTRTPPFDPLCEYSLEVDGPGAYLTCNIAYRYKTFCEIGGFEEALPAAACSEDIDLAFRVLMRGPIGFHEAMSIVHVPRRMRASDLARRGRLAASECFLFDRHRDRFGRGGMLPAVVFVLFFRLRYWLAPRTRRRARLESARRICRYSVIAGGDLSYAAVSTIRTRGSWRVSRSRQPVMGVPVSESPL